MYNYYNKIILVYLYIVIYVIFKMYLMLTSIAVYNLTVIIIYHGIMLNPN